MAKKARQLDTPFRTGERVQTMATVGDIAEGTVGKVRLANGIGPWRRYWVTFSDGRVRGQISHADLARPDQVEQWHEHQAQLAELALRSEEEATAAVEAAASDSGAAPADGVASKIPAALLERSRAAKARLLG